jgi:hypothetical protein
MNVDPLLDEIIDLRRRLKALLVYGQADVALSAALQDAERQLADREIAVYQAPAKALPGPLTSAEVLAEVIGAAHPIPPSLAPGRGEYRR